MSDNKSDVNKLKEMKWSYRLASFVTYKPWHSLTIFAVILLLTLPAIFSIEAMWSPRIWFDRDHQEIQKLDRFEQQFGSDTFVSLGLYAKNGIFQNKVLETLKNVTDEMWQVDNVIRVESLSNYNYIEAEDDDIIIEPFISGEKNYSSEELTDLKSKALSDDVLPDFFVSPDSTYAIIYAYMIPSLHGEDPDFSVVVDKVREIIKKYQTDEIVFYITGPAAGNDAFREVSKSDNIVLIPFMFAFLLTLLFLQFRSYTSIFLPLALIVTTIGATFGLMGHFSIILNSLLSAIPGVLLAICIADSVHILNSYFFYRNHGKDSRHSILYSLTKNAQPTILTSISTAISFFSITHTDLAPIRDLGILSGSGTMLAWIFTYLFLGAVISLLSPFLDKYPVKSFHFDDLFNKNQKHHELTDEEKRAVSLKKAKLINKYRWPIFFSFTALCIGSVLIAIQNEVNSDPMKYFHETVPIRQAYDFTSQKLDGLRGIELVVDSGKEEGIKDPKFLNKLDAYMNKIVEDPEITRVRSVREIIKKMNQTLHSNDPKEYRIPDSSEAVGQLLFLYTMGLPQGMDLNNQYTLDNRRLRIKVTWNLTTSRESELKSNELLKIAKEFDLDVDTGGNAPIYLSMNTKVVNTFFSSMAMALVLVSLLLLVVYHDLFISLLAMLPNIVPLIFGGALMQLLGKPIDIGTSIVSTVCLGIAVDDTIHFISSYKQYRKLGMSPLDAIAETFMITGNALIVTTLLLVVGFGSFIFAEFVPNRNFGILCSMILALALITDLVFLPALLLIADRQKDNEVNQNLDEEGLSSRNLKLNK